MHQEGRRPLRDRPGPPRVPVERMRGSSVIDVLDRVLDKGIVIDAWLRVALTGIDLLTIQVRVVVASIETYLKYSPELTGHVPPASEEPPAATVGPAHFNGQPGAACLVQAAVGAWNAHDPRSYAALLNSRYISRTHAIALPLRGRVATCRAMQMKLKLVPDLRFAVEGVIIRGDNALVSWVATGTRGNEPLRISGCTVGGVRHGKIVDTWCYWDANDLLASRPGMRGRTSDGSPTVHRLAAAS